MNILSSCPPTGNESRVKATVTYIYIYWYRSVVKAVDAVIASYLTLILRRIHRGVFLKPIVGSLQIQMDVAM